MVLIMRRLFTRMRLLQVSTMDTNIGFCGRGLCAWLATMLVVFSVASFPALADQSDGAGNAQQEPEPDWEIYQSDILDVKFREGAEIRLRNGGPQNLKANGPVRDDLDKIFDAEVNVQFVGLY